MREVRRTTLAARLKAVFGSVDRLDAFTGMLSEQHLPGSELGELQNAIWTDQFTRLRDGDRFFYLNDPALRVIEQRFGINYRTTLARAHPAQHGRDRPGRERLPAAGRRERPAHCSTQRPTRRM